MEIEMYEEERNGKKGRVSVLLKPEEVSKAIGRGGVNIRLASELTGYEIDVKREGLEEDVELTEFVDEIEDWVITEFKKIGLDTARSVLETSVAELVKRTDLEEETILDGNPAIVPSIQGWAKVFGYNTIVIDDEDDPYAHGFQVI